MHCFSLWEFGKLYLGVGKSEAEKQLELIVIGSESNFEEALNRGRRENVFLEDSGIAEAEIPKARWEDPDDEDNIVQVGKQRRYKRLRAPDEKVINGETLSKRLRDEFEKNLPAPVWATQKPAADENAFGLLGTSTESYIDRKSDRLPIQNFGFKRVTNLNFENPAKGIVHAVQFHPSAQIAMTASFGRTATIFQVDGKSNPKLKSVFFERFPISGAGFLSGGNEVLVCSKVGDGNTRSFVSILSSITESGVVMFQLVPGAEKVSLSVCVSNVLGSVSRARPALL